MVIAVPKEILSGENRVSIVPDVASKLIKKGFTINVESNAGFNTKKPGQRFLKGTVHKTTTIPSGGFQIKVGNTVVASISSNGDLYARSLNAGAMPPYPYFLVKSGKVKLFSVDNWGNAYISDCYTESWNGVVTEN